MFDKFFIISLLVLWVLFSFNKIKLKILVTGILLALTGISIFEQSNMLLQGIILSTLPLIIFFSFYNKYSQKNILKNFNRITGNYVLLISLVFGLSSILLVLTSLFSISLNPLLERNFVNEISLLIASFSPIYLIILNLSYPIKIFTKPIFQKLKIKPIDLSLKAKLAFQPKVFWIFAILILSIMLNIIPHLETVNPNNLEVSVDTPYYTNWISALMNSQDGEDFFNQAFVVQRHGDRPFSLITFFGIAKISPSNLTDTIENLGILLAPALVIVTYFFTRQLTSNDTTSLLAAFLTAVSFHTVGGIYAGLYANWFALVIGFLCFTFLLKFLKEPKKLFLILYSILLFSLLLSHSHTWTILVLVMSIFLLIMFKLKHFKRKSIALLLIIISVSVIVDFERTLLGSSGGIQKELELMSDTTNFGFKQIPLMADNMSIIAYTLLGGQISNFIMLGLCLYWVFRCDIKKNYNILIMIFFSVAIIPMIFGNTTIHLRILYDIPYQIPAAIALTNIIQRPNGKIILLVISIWLISSFIRNASNLIPIFPQ